MTQRTFVPRICFIYFCLGLSFVSVPARSSSLNVTARNGTRFYVISSAPVHLTITESFSIDQSDSVAFGNCDATCFKTEKKKGVSCALVSSAGTLLSTNLGDKIDSYDVIMRSSWAPIKGYEAHVGSRTDIRLGGFFDRTTPPLLGHDGSERVLFLHGYSSIPGFPGGDEEASNKACETSLRSYRQKFQTNNSRSSSCVLGSFLAPLAPDGTVSLFPGVHHPSSAGFIMANFLGGICDTLTLFGFSLSDSLDDSAREAGYKYHYYFDSRKKSRKLFAAEKTPLAAQKSPIKWHHDFKEERRYFQERSSCACRDGYTGVYFLDVNKMRPLPPSVKIIMHDEITKGTSPGGIGAVKQLFQQMKKDSNSDEN